MPEAQRARRLFLTAWIVVTAIKCIVASRLPLFVDEAFYWQEGRHLAMAYSDLPGLTAWMIRLGTTIGGEHLLAVRLPFLLVGALLPWLVMRIAARWFGETLGWKSGLLVVLMPLSGTLGLLALPDVPMALATVLCLDAGARLLRDSEAAAAAELALGLAIGALSHYRFAGVIGVGLIALAWLPQGRLLLRDPRVWVALSVGVAAWVPLILWNLENADAGVRFQLVDRHPWAFQPAGLRFLPIQALLVTPLLFAVMMQVVGVALRPGTARVQWRYFGLLGGVSTLGIFVLGFFTDAERVSFHWSLPGYLALLVATPVVLGRWPRFWRRAAWWLAGAGLVAMLGYYVAVSVPAWRQQAAAEKFYPRNFAGWDVLADAVREELAQLPVGTRVLADDFKLGAELGFALGDPDVAVLDHPLNHKHGRAPQLRLWGLQGSRQATVPRLLVLAPGDLRYRDLLQRYHDLCAMVGPLPPPRRTVLVDHGAQRFLLFALPATPAPGPCVTPAMAWVNEPVPKAAVPRRFRVTGWAFKDGVGLERVEVLLDGKVLAEARYGVEYPITDAWKISTDPNHPRVGFDAEIEVPATVSGRHWLGLRLHGSDGSIEDWEQQPLVIGK